MNEVGVKGYVLTTSMPKYLQLARLAARSQGQQVDLRGPDVEFRRCVVVSSYRFLSFARRVKSGGEKENSGGRRGPVDVV